MFKKVLATALLALCTTSAFADIIIDQTNGTVATTYWNGSPEMFFPEAFTRIGSTAGNSAFITVGSAKTIDLNLYDLYIPGDAFQVFLDGAELLPTSGNTGPDTRGRRATSLFNAYYDDVLLTAGSHAFTFFLTNSCCNGGSGGLAFSPVQEAAAAVPEPASIALLGLGMLGLGAARRKLIKK